VLGQRAVAAARLGAVAGFTHRLHRAAQFPLLGVGQVARAAPAGQHGPRAGGRAVVHGALQRGQRQHALADHARGQLGLHLGAAAAQHQCLKGLFQRLAVLARTQARQRAFAVAVQVVHQRLGECRVAVQRRAAQHQREGRVDAVPARQACRFVDHHQPGLPGVDGVGVRAARFVADDAPFGRSAAQETSGLALPAQALVGAAVHQHPLDAGMAVQQHGGGQCLHRLAEPALVGQQGAAGAGGEERAFGLERRERRTKQVAQRGAGRAVGVGLLQREQAPPCITPARQLLPGGRVDLERVPGQCGFAQQGG
jgi:hypothetical protein